MKRWLTILLVLSMLLAQTSALAAGTHTLRLDIDFEENRFLSRYDVDVYINGEQKATIRHGKSLDEAFQVPAGVCSIEFRKEDDRDVKGLIKIGVSADTEFKCDIKATHDEVEISNVSTTGAEVDMRAAVGDVVEIDSLRITLTKYRIDNGSSFNKPEKGNVYVLCEFEIQNLSDDEIVISTLMNFEASCDDYELEYSLGALMEATRTLDESIRPGKKLKGEIGFEVPKNWVEIEIDFTSGFWSADKAVFVVTK